MHSLNDILGFKLHAADDQFGSVNDVYFDDQRWGIRYIVADTGNWLPGRKVLIAPASAGEPDWRNKSIPLVLNRTQIENSPPITADKPVSRQLEEELTRYYGWPRYWAAAGFPAFDVGSLPHNAPGLPLEKMGENVPQAGQQEASPKGDPHLRSFREVKGYHIRASDEEIGHVEDFLADLRKWNIHHLIVDTRNWLPGKEVLISCDDISEVNWKTGRVYLSISKKAVENAPLYSHA